MAWFHFMMLTHSIKRSLDLIRNVSTTQWIVLGMMIAIGISSRLVLEPQWNFKPVAALILFGGFYFQDWLLAVVAMIAIMLPSDYQLGFYDWPIMAATYGSLMLAAGLGGLVRRVHGTGLNGWSWIISFGGAALAMSVLFHLLTNAAVWWMWYPRSGQGLVDCFVAAMPFFRPTLESNLMFTGLTVGCYFMTVRIAALRESAEAVIHAE